MEPVEDKTYDAENDTSVVRIDDTRKSRLSLKDINRARKAADQHKEEAAKDLNFVRQMYGLAAQAALGG
jgi:predicted RNA-binding protein with RPS1 domain